MGSLSHRRGTLIDSEGPVQAAKRRLKKLRSQQKEKRKEGEECRQKDIVFKGQQREEGSMSIEKSQEHRRRKSSKQRRARAQRG